jgi:hypothetical protein
VQPDAADAMTVAQGIQIGTLQRPRNFDLSDAVVNAGGAGLCRVLGRRPMSRFRRGRRSCIDVPAHATSTAEHRATLVTVSELLEARLVLRRCGTTR